MAHGAAAAGKEILRLANQLAVVGQRDFACAGRRAALDLIEQTGPRAVGVIAVGAGAQQEGALQRAERSMHRAGAGERPKIIALDVARAAMFGDARRVVIAGDENIGKALVVAQQHIVARLQLFDEIGFEQQRFRLRLDGDEHHRRGLRDHAGDAGRLPLRRRVGEDAFLDRTRLADIEHLAVLADHAIDARA